VLDNGNGVVYNIGMKTLILTCLAITMMVSPAYAGEWFTWEKKNTELHYYVTGLMIADLGQTLYIADNCTPDATGAYEESENNYFLGNCPSREEVKEYFGWAYLAITGITYILPDKWSQWFQKGTITVELMAVGDNISVNVGWGF